MGSDMKKLTIIILLLILIIFSSLQAQKFLSLDGVEDQNGNTILIFRFGHPYHPQDHIYFSIYSYAILSGSTNKIMNAFRTVDPWLNPVFKSVQDFEFRNDHSLGFINIGIISIGYTIIII